MSSSRPRARRSDKAAEDSSLRDKRSLRIGESWSVVEGENESFDARRASFEGDEGDEVLSPLSSGQPSSFSSQMSSQGNMGMRSGPSSQDSIRDFAKHQHEDKAILRIPFPPSIGSPSSSRTQRGYRTEDPQFKMPRIDVGGSRHGSGSSSRTIRPLGRGTSYDGEDETYLRRRGKSSSFQDGYSQKGQSGGLVTISDMATPSMSSALLNILAWAGEIILIALNFAKYPLGLLLAVYLVFGGAIIVQNMATRSVYTAMSPICRLPGTSYLNLPFCPPPGATDFGGLNATAGQTVEFDDLMGVQSKFEQVLERSADGASLPFEMKRSETAVRDLRTLVRNSDIQARHELALEFDGYIETARLAASDLQRFNTHVGSAVDSVISINRWTSRYIDSLSLESDTPSSVLAGWTYWIFYPFQPADQPFSERIILDKYIEHTGLVSERISALILEAQAVLRLLTKAEDHLSLIYDITSRTSASVSSRREEILWNIWTLVGANSRSLKSLSKQLSLLQQVDSQRSTAVDQISGLIIELESIQANLGDLRDRVAEPQLLSDSETVHIPLSVHIETIDRGVERLQAARRRIRAAEDDRVRDVMARGGLRSDDDRLIENGRGQ
ncbi:hypothetical protein X797_006251 [Metarhizium robertsii]|uniref:Uncharacterized protein n=2 Tax=Metarhizium robertsii TaxID=568076 RepID=E9F5A5_METRA|nr:uncharacterized protein MAA_07454 [Metarhizium robertsii ARSEF 23]EFY97158.1 hypothetical protein MAA_07454 [Metarhizium robertsii ARSEF 23]EXV00535.1 hypothetical protein X797_006251 [Metarhizium robertsii]